MSPLPTSAPSETDFLAAFGVRPVEAAPGDGYWAYNFDGPGDSRVRFSFNTHQGSVQTACFVGVQRLAAVVSEGAESIRIGDDERIHVVFADPVGTTLTVAVFPVATVDWALLR
jgi:hypothetical protein